MERLQRLYESYYGCPPEKVLPIAGSASNRRYCRLTSEAGTCVGVVGTDIMENRAFLAIARHFRSKGISVPEVLAVSDDEMVYIQEDLGHDLLLSMYDKARKRGEDTSAIEDMLCRTMALLPKIQFEGAEGLDFNARNVMISGDVPYFIDFQGGRRGPVYYDVASFVWQARAEYPEELQKRMVESYLGALSGYMTVSREEFNSRLRLFILFRLMQAMGAYGFRGWSEHKAKFVASIPAALKSLENLLGEPFEDYPYLMETLKKMIGLPRFAGLRSGDGRLEVKVYSFSFMNGMPEDPSGNGGGYVFDCRALNNPGRHIEYKYMTGMDEPVIRFLEDDGGVFGFLDHAYSVVDPHVEYFQTRGFTSLLVSFGCTGGQHRSVYCAEHMAEHLAARHPDIRVRLIHREQGVDRYL